MPLTAGTKLGPYEIVSALGAGGMGEVYRARDTRLQRDVAIKILSSQLSHDAELKGRFEREARVVAQLQHPHICTLHDVGSENGTDFLVMELLEGETLSERLRQGPLPLAQLLLYAGQVADALHRAHRAGVIHRDLKPGNVMLTKAGAKLLDFGLAKPAALAAGAVASSTSKSVFTAALTQSSPASPLSPLSSAGTLIGTVQYMAPEQIAGQEADARSDVFAFGVMLYEMATGKRAFEGKTQASIVGSILAVEPPPITTFQPQLPPALSKLVQSCLVKDPEERLQSVYDLKLQLETIGEVGAAPSAPAERVAGKRSRTGWIAAAVATLALAAVSTFYVMQATRPKPVVRSYILAPEKTTFVTLGAAAGLPVLSPDGTHIAFTARDEKGRSALYVRPLHSLTAQALAGTEGGPTLPFWSPDSRAVGFFNSGKLRKVEAAGGPPQALCDVNGARGGTWSRDGVIVLAASTGDPLVRIPAAGGTPVPASKFDAGENTHRWPQFLPDGKHFLFWVRSAKPENTGIHVGALDSLEHRLVLRNDTAGYYEPSGHLLFVRDQTLMAQPFSVSKLATTGDAFPVAEHVAVNGNVYRPVFSAADNGTLAYQSGDTGNGTRLTWVDRDGKPAGAVGEVERFLHPAISPDGKQVAVSIADATGSRDIWIFDQAGHKTRLTFDPATEANPRWSSDGKKVFYSSDRKGQNHIYAKAADGSGAEETVLETGGITEVPYGISADGRYLAYHQQDPARKTGGSDIWVLPLFGDRKPFPIVATQFAEFLPTISPDGKWMAYVSNETSLYQVYLTPFPGGGPKWQVSTAGGAIPRWRWDGKELYFVGSDNRLLAVDVTLGATSPKLGTPKALFQANFASGPAGPYDATADGKKFLVHSVNAQESDVPLTLVTNWTAELKK